MQPDTQAWDLGAAWSGESRGVPQGRGARATWKQRGGGRPPPCIWPRERLSSQAGRQGLPTGARASGIVEKTPPHNLQPPQPPPPRPLQVLQCPAALGTTEGHMPTSEAHRSVCCGDQARPADGRTWLPSAAGSRERVGGLRRGRPDGLWGGLARNASQTGLCWGSTESGPRPPGCRQVAGVPEAAVHPAGGEHGPGPVSIKSLAPRERGGQRAGRREPRLPGSVLF